MAGPSKRAAAGTQCPCCGRSILKGSYVRPIFKPSLQEAVAKDLTSFRTSPGDTAWWIHQNCFFRLLKGKHITRSAIEATREFWATAPLLIAEMQDRNLPITHPASPLNRD